MLTTAQWICLGFGVSLGLLVGFVLAWYVVDRDYASALERQVRGEAHQPLRHLPPAVSFSRAPSGQFYDFRIHE